MKVMKIYILNAPNTFNYGSMMMAENFISYFDKVSKTKNVYYVETDDAANTQLRLRTATLSDNIYAVPKGSLYKNKSVSRKQLVLSAFIKLDILSDLAHECDAVVVLGGDDYTEDYGWRSLVSQLFRINTIVAAKKVYFIGQTMGPFHSFRIPAAKFFLSRAEAIMARDVITLNNLRKLKLKNIGEIPDLALLPLARESSGPKENKYICVFPSELIYRFSKIPDRSMCLDFYVKICEYLSQDFPKYKIMLLPHVLKPEESDDRAMVRDIYNKLDEKSKSKTIMIDSELYPYEIREYIRNSNFIVSARMHPVISAVESNIPWICFSYSRKYWGILGEGYGLGDYIIDVRELDYGTMLSSFKKTLGILQGSYFEIIARMRSKLEKDQNEIIKVLSQLASAIRGQ